MESNFNRRDFMKIIGIAGLSATFAKNIMAAENPSKPNIILCMVDDMGKEGVSCYNPPSTFTPNIDRLAAQGMKFNNYYVMPQCTPTRVSLLTGQYPFRNGWVNHYDVPRWDLKGFSPNTNPCIGNVMKSAGYSTCIAGKWQINDFRREPEILNACGFDEYCMWTGGESGNEAVSDLRYWNPYIHTKQGSRTYTGQYGPDIYNDFIIDFIDQHKTEPMFIYYPMTLQHGPLETQPLGMTPHQYIDHLVGKIETALINAGIRNNTIIIFKTDNGLHKAQTDELGACVPLIINCPGLVPAGIETDALVDVTDFMPTCAELAGAKLPSQYTYDGKSFAGLLRGDVTDSSRDWILAMGGNPCVYPTTGEGPFEASNQMPYRDRVLRDKTYKVYVNTEGQIVKMVNLKNDPLETTNIITTVNPVGQEALRKFQRAVKCIPCRDANPRYEN